MSVFRFTSLSVARAFAVAAIVTALASPAAAQAVSATDIQRLQDDVMQASGDLSRLRDTDPGLAGRLRSDLDDLSDDVIYLKVKLRREGASRSSTLTSSDACRIPVRPAAIAGGNLPTAAPPCPRSPPLGGIRRTRGIRNRGN
jgi:hypothetical protein